MSLTHRELELHILENFVCAVLTLLDLDTNDVTGAREDGRGAGGWEEVA